jgi:RimJ/RimL family protein N-acetyltransferase
MAERGTRVHIRALEKEDLDLLVEWRNDPQIAKGFFNTFPLTHAGQARWFDQYLECGNELLFIIEDEQRTPIGTIGFSQIDFKNQRAELGRLLIGSQSHTGKGYAKHAVLWAEDFGFDELNLNRIFLRVLADNVRAVELYKRCGFRQEGLLRMDHFSQGRWHDVLIMGVLREERRRYKEEGQ